MTSTRSLNEQIAVNVARVRAEIAYACARSDRNPDDVTLVGVTKNADRRAVDALITAGVHDLGENRVQDALTKFGLRGGEPPLPADVRLHMIGNLQTNKARDVVQFFAVVHSLNRIALADALQQAAAREHKTLSLLAEVNLSGEETKQGADVEEIRLLLGYVASNCANLSIDGVMTIAPNTDDRDAIRATFRTLRTLRDALQQDQGVALPVLSMGMSNDYPIAIEEGATHIRVGRALFTDV